jgi:hypothetical protein
MTRTLFDERKTNPLLRRRYRLLRTAAGLCTPLLLVGFLNATADMLKGTNMTTDPKPASVQVTGVGPWVRYRDPDASLDYTFEYPGNWVLSIDQGKEQPYWQALILGPRNAGDGFSATLTVRRLPTTAPGALYKDLPTLIDERRRQASASAEYELAEEGERQVDGLAARQADFTYVVPLPIDSIHPKPTKLRARQVQFARGEALYELHFAADAQDFPAFEHVFDHLVESFHFDAPATEPQ